MALEQLDVKPAMHLVDLALQPAALGGWQEAADGEEVDWGGLLGDWQATVDWPGATFWKQIWEAFPKSKVVLTTRNPQDWYESCLNTIYATSTGAAGGTLQSGPFSMMPGIIKLSHQLVWEGTFDNRFDDESHAIEVFNRHNRQVEEVVPEDELLVYEIKEGWEPLCDFIEVPVPDAPFPHLNDTTSFRALSGLPPMVA